MTGASEQNSFSRITLLLEMSLNPNLSRTIRLREVIKETTPELAKRINTLLNLLIQVIFATNLLRSNKRFSKSLYLLIECLYLIKRSIKTNLLRNIMYPLMVHEGF